MNYDLPTCVHVREKPANRCSGGKLFWLVFVGATLVVTPGRPQGWPLQTSARSHDPRRAALPRQQSLNGEWNLWFDGKANWQAEELVLHPANIAEVPVYPPSVGWDEMLKRGQPYRVPATWNEVYPRQHGVGWYWRPVSIPTSAKGKGYTPEIRSRAAQGRSIFEPAAGRVQPGGVNSVRGGYHPLCPL
jgi:hypothetical protein